MRYVYFDLDNGFIGCTTEFVGAYSNDTTDEELDRIFEELNFANADYYLDDCVDNPADQAELDWYYSNLLGNWVEISEDEYFVAVGGDVEELNTGETDLL